MGSLGVPYHKMFIPYTLQTFYSRLCNGFYGSNQIFKAMMQATKDSMKKIRARKICDFLISLKRLKIGTGDVESNVRRTCDILSVDNKVKVIMQIMRQKVADAFKCLKEVQLSNSKSWR